MSMKLMFVSVKVYVLQKWGKPLWVKAVPKMKFKEYKEINKLNQGIKKLILKLTDRLNTVLLK